MIDVTHPLRGQWPRNISPWNPPPPPTEQAKRIVEVRYCLDRGYIDSFDIA